MRISPSAISSFFSCPARFRFSRMWSPTESKPWLEQGSIIHELLEHELDTTKVKSKFTRSQLERATLMWNYAVNSGYTITKHEQREEYPLPGTDILLVRIIDAFAVWKDDPILVDWKTASKEWNTINGVAPKGAGFQACAYLLGKEESQIHFIVNSSGTVHSYRYERNKEDETNLLHAIDLVNDAHLSGKFPKNRGMECQWCDFAPMCYNQDNWETKYKRRTEHE